MDDPTHAAQATSAIRPNSTLVQRLRKRYRQLRGVSDVDFGDFIRECAEERELDLDDDTLAELIEFDGRWRLGRSLTAPLERYLDALPDLCERRDPLDAAIDVALRSAAAAAGSSGRADPGTVNALIAAHPEIEQAIREAAMLSNALCSTQNFQQGDVVEREHRQLPQDFGPPLALPPGADPELAGRPRYQLQRLLGHGGFGHVYLALDRQLSEPDHPALVAVKILSSANRSQWSRHRLIEEATKARRVDHPNVVRVLDRGVSADDEDFIVYELVEGGDLDQWYAVLTAGGRMIPIRRAVELAARIARGIEAAHSAGLVHCDLKPGNIILTADDQPKIADFGIAIRSGDVRGSHGAIAGSRHPIGNLAFISPEQYRMDEGALSVPSDIYALGGILFMLLTGKLPNGESKDEIDAIHKKVTDGGRANAPLLRPLRSEIDRDLEAICRRALAPEPGDRYSAAGSLADDLESWLRCEPLYWTRPSPVRIAGLWMRRKPGEAVATALLVLALIAGAILVHALARAADRAAASLEIAQAQTEAEHARAETERVRAEEAARRNERVREVLALMRTSAGEQLGVGIPAAQFLPMMWAIDSMIGPDVLGDFATGTSSLRFDAVERLVNQAIQHGRQGELDAMLWRSNLAFWLVARGDVERAEPMLVELRSEWSERLHTGDRWLSHIDAMIASAAAKRELQSPSVTADVVLRDLRIALEGHEAMLAILDHHSPLHYLVLEAMSELLGPQGLNDEAALAAVQSKIATDDDRRIYTPGRPRRRAAADGAEQARPQPD